VSDRCQHCAETVDREVDVFCPHCHRNLLEPAARPSGPAPAPATAEASTWQCPRPGCGGTSVPVGEACPFCGTAAPTDRRLRLVNERFEILLAGPGPWTLGREASDSPQLATFERVSRQHASIAVQGDAYVVADMRSTNGTFVEGHRISDQPAPLPGGTTLRLGQSVELHVDPTS
jgi:hypothetical protein